MVGFGVSQVVHCEVNVTERLALDAERSWSLCTGADEDCSVTVPEEVINHEDTAYCCVEADLNPHIGESSLVGVKKALWESELRDTVLHDAADFALPLEDSYVVAFTGH